MKANVTRVILLRAILLILLSLYFLLVFGQPDYDFTNGSLVSGTANQVGAIYKYTNVRPGVDATVEIKFISPGISVDEIDAGSGYAEALQPTLKVDPYTDGYLHMIFQFLVAGTSTPYTALEVPVSCIDVDGSADNDGLGNPLYEYDEVDLGGGYVDFSTVGGELTIQQSGSKFKGKNMWGVEYPGRDTAAKAVMFTVVNVNVSSFEVKVGVDNQSDASTYRLRSVYFKKFIYPFSVLSSSQLFSFKGSNRLGKINLDWSLTASNSVDEIELQKSYTGRDFSPIATFLNQVERQSAARYSYADLQTTPVVYYRLKLTNLSGKTEYSNILSFKTGSAEAAGDMKVYPTVVTGGQFSAAVTAHSKQESTLQIIDFSGRIVHQKKISLEQGANTFLINDFNNSLKGNYVVIIKTDNQTQSGKIIIQ
jgi:hypothetical protein